MKQELYRSPKDSSENKQEINVLYHIRNRKQKK